MNKYTFTIILTMLTAVGFNPVAAIDGDASSASVAQDTFDDHWQSGEQHFQLKDSLLTSELLSVEEIKRIAQNKTRSQSPVRIANSNDFVKTVGFQEQQNQNQQAACPEQPAAVADSDRGIFPAASRNGDKSNDDLRREIGENQAAIKADDQISDAERSSRLKILTLANETLQKLLELNGQRIQYEKEIEDIKSNEKKYREDLNEIVKPTEPVVDETTKLDDLTRQLKERRETLETWKAALKKLEQDIKFRSERVTQIPGDRAKANEKLAKLVEDIAGSTTEDTDSQLGMLLLQIKQRATGAELKKLDSEVKRQEWGAKVDPIQRDLWSREVKRLEEEVLRWESACKKIRDAEVAEEKQEADQKALTAHWRLKPLAERNAELIEEQKTIVAKLQALKSSLTKTDSQIESIVKQRTEIENKIEAAGLTATNGMLLVGLRRTLITTGDSHIQIRKLQTELRHVNLSNVSLTEERDELADPAATVKLLLASDETENALTKKAIEFVETKRDYLDQLIDDYQSYGRLISEVSEARKKLIDEINHTLAYIDENALWIRSSDPVAVSDFSEAKNGLSDFFNSDQWSKIAISTQQRMSNRLYESAIALFSMVFLFAANRRFKQKLQPDQTDESST